VAEFYSGLSVNITPIHWWIIAPVFSLMPILHDMYLLEVLHVFGLR